jgi:hypothetical protein
VVLVQQTLGSSACGETTLLSRRPVEVAGSG